MPQTITWQTHDAIEIFGTHFAAPKSKGLILLTHGWGDHQGRYADTVRRLIDNGFSVLAHDLRGHGRSKGKRGYAPSFDVFRDDLRLAMQQTRSISDPSKPVFMYGQSFGGLIALSYLLHHSDEIKDDSQFGGAIITSPLLGLEMKVPNWKILAGRTLCALNPTMTLKSGIDLSKLSRNPEHAAKIAADPLRQGRISAQVFFGMRKAMEWTMANAHRLPCKTLLMHGEADRVTSPHNSKMFSGQSPTQTELYLWPEMYHELHTEIDNSAVFSTMFDWLERGLVAHIQRTEGE